MPQPKPIGHLLLSPVLTLWLFLKKNEIVSHLTPLSSRRGCNFSTNRHSIHFGIPLRSKFFHNSSSLAIAYSHCAHYFFLWSTVQVMMGFHFILISSSSSQTHYFLQLILLLLLGFACAIKVTSPSVGNIKPQKLVNHWSHRSFHLC